MSTEHLAAATQRRATQARAQARAAIRMDRDGVTINYVSVARTAGVSRALLYRDPDLRKEINRLRDTHSANPGRQPAAERMSPSSRDELLATLRHEVQILRTENHTLRTRLAAVLGEERLATTNSPHT